MAGRLSAALRDPLSGHLLRGSAVSMGVRVAGLALAFLSHVVISRQLGASQYGIYSIALGWALILTIPARLGMDNAVLRFATIYSENGRWSELKGLVRFAFGVIAAASLLIAAALWLENAAGSPLLGGLGSDLAVWIAAMVFPLAALGLLSALMRTARLIAASQAYEQVLRPGLLIVAVIVAAAVGLPLSAEGALMLTVVSTALALLGIGFHFSRVFPALRTVAAGYRERGEWLSLSWPLLVMSVIQEILNQIDVILLGRLAGAEAAGHYAAAWRLGSLASFALVALTMLSGPMIASAHHRGDLLEMARIARLIARISLATTIILAAGIALVGPFALDAFGPGFDAAYPALLVVLIGALFNAATGAVAYLMTMTGRQKAALPIFAAALAANLGANFMLIPRLGTLGAAMASATSIIVWNVLMLIYVRRTLGIDASAVAAAPRPERWRAA
jgi:O-antigen/teichoic acid export membrane protein